MRWGMDDKTGWLKGWMVCLLGLLSLLVGLSVQAQSMSDGEDYLLVGSPTNDQAPVRACKPQTLEGLQRRLEIPAPKGGWSGAPQAVEVFNVFYGEVMISHGDREVCGHMQDVRTRDSRFRSGIGMVLVPKAGDTNPILVAWSEHLKQRWIPTVRLGAPSPLQQEDTARMLARAACMAIVVALAMSALMGFVSTRDRSFVMYVLACGLLVIWQAVFSGLSGYPWPWVPVGDRAAQWLVALSTASVGVMVKMLWRLCGGEDWFPASRPWVLGQMWLLIGLAILLLFAPLAVLKGVASVLDIYLGLACVAAFFVGLRLLSRPEVDAVDGVLAVTPLLLAGITDFAGSSVLIEYRVEILQLSVTWFLMVAAYALNRRLGLLRRQRDELQQLADTDSLTGLPNRRAGMGQLGRYIRQSLTEGQPLSIGFLDIDLFKQINDRYGHDVGDEVLVGVATALSGAVRNRQDIVRMGGEEFLVLLPGADAEAAMQRLEQLRQRVGEVSGTLHHPGLEVTASIGLAEFKPEDDVASLLRRADGAMYEAKRGGRNRVVFAQDEAVPA